jgi:hypothetical protein
MAPSDLIISRDRFLHPWKLYNVIFLVNHVFPREVILTLCSTLVNYQLAATCRTLGFFLLWRLFFVRLPVECLPLFAFFFLLVGTLLVIQLLKVEGLLAIVSGTVGMVLHDVLNGIRILKCVLMLGILQIEALIQKLKMVCSSKG